MRQLLARSSVVAVGLAAFVASNVQADDAKIGTLELKGALAEQPDPFAWLSAEPSPTLRDVIATLDGVAEDTDLDGLVLRLKDAALTRSQIEEIGGAINRVRDAGKKVHLFAEIAGTQEMLVGCYTDEIIVQSGSMVSVPGMYMEEIFLADTLGWVGVKAQLIQIGDYKGANEMFVNAEPSEAWNQNINQLLDSLYAHMCGTLKAGRGFDDTELQHAMERGWAAYADEAAELGLIDTVLDLASLSDHLEQEYGADSVSWQEIQTTTGAMSLKLDEENPFAAFMQLSTLMKEIMEGPEYRPDGPTIAIVHIDGPIVDGDSTPAGLFGGASVGSRTVRNTLEELRNDDLIKGVIVRINSPGGSAIASDVIWQGVRRTAELKPVWISVGSMAASGGYYIAVSGDKIYVNDSSIVGSIGVVGGKFAMGGLYDKLKIGVVERARGPAAHLGSSASAWTEAELSMVRERMHQVYDRFTSRVTAGRPGIDLSRTAEGRLFTGDKAIALNMADELGSLDDAISAMADELGLTDYDVMDYPGPKGLNELLEQMFGPLAEAPGMRADPTEAMVEALRQAVGPHAWPAVRDGLSTLVLLREEPVLLIAPRTLVVK